MRASTDPPDEGAVSVLNPAYGLTGSAATDGDATPAFAAAIDDALRSGVRRPGGPTGPQAVVYVPAGSYRLGGLELPSDVRLEVDAGAVLEPVQAAAGGDPDAGAVGQPVHMLLLGDHSDVAVTNVSIVGVGTTAPDAGLKARAQPTYGGWDLSGYFTVDLDASDSGGRHDMGFASLVNVQGFEVSNVYVVQNDTIPSCSAASSTSCPVGAGSYPYPTTGRAAIVYRPARASGSTSAGPFYDPTDGRLSGVYSIGAPYGTGPTQITSGHDVQFADLYSEGGTTLRLETDASALGRHIGELADVTATHVVGVRCNRAVALSAHRQHNARIAISDVTSVACQSGLVQSSNSLRGSFTDTTIAGMKVLGGPGAQLSAGGSGLWWIGQSTAPIDVQVNPRKWSANMSALSCSGGFSTTVFDRILMGSDYPRPVCSSSSG